MINLLVTVNWNYCSNQLVKSLVLNYYFEEPDLKLFYLVFILEIKGNIQLVMTIDYYYSWPIPQIIHIIDCFSAAFLHHKSRILHLWQGFENRSSYKEDPLAGTKTVSVNVQISTSALLHFDYSKLAIDETHHSLRKHSYCCYCSSFAKVEVAYDCCLNIWCLIVVLRASLTRLNSSACV